MYLQVHLSNKVLVCRICEKDAPTPRELTQHMRQNHHPCEMPYVCQLCNFRSSMYNDVVDHFKKVYLSCLWEKGPQCHGGWDPSEAHVLSPSGTKSLFVWSFHYFPILCANNKGSGETVRWAGSPESSSFAYWISTIFTSAGSYLKWNWEISSQVLVWVTCGLYEPPRDKINTMACAPSEDSDQPGHPPSLIRVFTVCSLGS